MTTIGRHSILLASASPRRRRLIDWLGLKHKATSTDVDETLDESLAGDPDRFARVLAERKALAALAASNTDPSSPASQIILGFDTIVVSDDTILGKPTDMEHARTMLRGLSGRYHQVITGVAIICPGDDSPESFSVSTPVLMRTLTEDSIDEWLEGDEALGCAGAYNIEHHLASVEIDECFQNVAGLPLCHLHRALGELPEACAPSGVMISPVEACNAARGVECQLGPKLVEGAPTT